MTDTKPFIDWPDKLTEKQAKDYEKHLKETHFSALWDDFCITEDPASLAVYVRAGGEVGDQKVRDLVADLLDKLPYKRTRTRRSAHKNIEAYLAIELLRCNLKISQPKAIVRYSIDHDLSDETVKSRYKAGKKWITDAHARIG